MRGSPQIILIADDLTGAADAAAGIATRGLVTVLTFSGMVPILADALVLSTESRALSEKQAVQAMRLLVRNLRRADLLSESTLIYKKIDSTLRGHAAGELATLMDSVGRNSALVAPAFPAQGRTTVDGHQLVGDARLEHSEFGQEVPASDLRALFATAGRPLVHLRLEQLRSSTDRLRSLLSDSSARIILSDIRTQDDLKRLARAALGAGLRLFCGSAGLMSALMSVREWRARVPMPDLKPAMKGPALIVAGSRHTRTQAQIRAVEKTGALILDVPPEADSSRPGCAASAETARQALERRRDVVLAAPVESHRPTTPEVANHLARAARMIVQRTRPASLVLTGGETAAAVCRALDVSAILLLGEIAPGIPHGRLQGGRLDDLPVATKAGGFGKTDILAAILQFFKSVTRT